ncbi:MAG: DNA-binding protein [Herbinix sp.]|jgi:transcriptional regulator with XRE-family HTH domain|nr:DNA-binding protein [Herbinix sp.]
MTLGEKLLFLRKAKSLSQEQLASEITVSRQAISKWELGESLPDTENIKQIMKIFDVTADFLLNDEIDIPITKSVNEETEEDVAFLLLKNELKDDSDKLALRMYESQLKGKSHSKLFWLLQTFAIFVFVLIGIYYLYLR